VFISKEIMTPIMWNIDRLQILRRDKTSFEMKLLNKDLRILSKERKEELLSIKCFLDIKDDSLFLSIDKNLP
jgi:hypothetical protein